MGAKRFPPCLGVLRLEIRNSVVVLQPHTAQAQTQPNGSKLCPSLSLDLKTGKVAASLLPLLPDTSQRVLGVVGMMRLEAGAVLALITKASKVGGHCGTVVVRQGWGPVSLRAMLR